MKLVVNRLDGGSRGEKELPAGLFTAPLSGKNVLFETLKHRLATKRQGTASVKTVATVHGTTAKPWRQKGTGRARAGTNKSPLWRGGGVIFGPHLRDYRYKLPKRLTRAAYAAIFTRFAKAENLFVLEDFALDVYNTKRVLTVFKAFSECRKVVYLATVPSAGERDAYLRMKKSAANIPWLKVMDVLAMDLPTLYYAKELVLAESAVTALVKLDERWTAKHATKKRISVDN